MSKAKYNPPRRVADAPTDPPKKRMVTFSVYGIEVDMRTITPELRARVTALGFTDWPDSDTTTDTTTETSTDI